MSELFVYTAAGIGGGLGAAARHALTVAITHRLPVSTLVVNILGSFILGVAMGVASAGIGNDTALLHRITLGFCGGFTTFSSFAWQTITLHRTESFIHAAVNVALNLVFCVALFAFGIWVGTLAAS